jgi:hypothetical protein
MTVNLSESIRGGNVWKIERGRDFKETLLQFLRYFWPKTIRSYEDQNSIIRSMVFKSPMRNYQRFFFGSVLSVSLVNVKINTNNSSKDFEKSIQELLSKKTNALVSENEIKIHDLVKSALEEIVEYSSLEENWDGYKAKSFKAETISLTTEALLEIKNNLLVENLVPEEITPGPASDGSIALEILYGTKNLIITILPDEKNEIVIYTNDGIINKEAKVKYPCDLRIYFEWLKRN